MGPVHPHTHARARGHQNNRLRGSSRLAFFSVLLILLYVLLGAWVFGCELGMEVAEGQEGWSFGTGLYFAVVTLSTVGYGDLAPHTTNAKLFTMAYLLGGLPFAGAALGHLGAWVAGRRERAQKRRRKRRLSRLAVQVRKLETGLRSRANTSTTQAPPAPLRSGEGDVVAAAVALREAERGRDSDGADPLPVPLPASPSRVSSARAPDGGGQMGSVLSPAQRREWAFTDAYEWSTADAAGLSSGGGGWLRRRILRCTWPSGDVAAVIWSFVLLGFVVAVGALVAGLVEPTWDGVDAMYWALTTVTTVGYGEPGDFPSRAIDRYFAVAYIPLGVWACSVALGAIAEAYMNAFIRADELLVSESRRRRGRMELAELLERSQHSRRGVDRADFLAWVLVASGRCARDELDEILEHFERLDVSKTGYLDAKELAALDVDAPSRMASRVSGRK